MMNRTSTGQRRFGRPQTKRVKLDVVTTPSSSSSQVWPNKSNETVNDCGNARKVPALTGGWGSAKVQNVAVISDWDDDDDFSCDMLEKACLIADLSQAISRNEPTTKETTTDHVCSEKSLKRTVSERDDPVGTGVLKELEKLRLQNEKLQNCLKTKEGEVLILRSQLKQAQEAKQAEILNNIKLMEERQSSYKEKMESTLKEFDAAKTALQFKDMELKSLTERCKEMESSSKVILIEPQRAQLDCKKAAFGTTQVTAKVILPEAETDSMPPIIEETFTSANLLQLDHEGRNFGTVICPEFFDFIEESSIISYYTVSKGCGFHVSSLDFDKREKYMWSGLPKQRVFVKDTYNAVSELFLYEDFSQKSAKCVTESVLQLSLAILRFQRDLLAYLEGVEKRNFEFFDSDRSLLENEEKVGALTLKRLLGAKRLNEKECGIETRRVLAMIVALITSSKVVSNMVVRRKDLALVLKDIVVSIGNLRKPVRYTGVLGGVALILIQFLKEATLDDELSAVLNEIMEEIIFSRPRLDVLILVIDVIAAASAANRSDFIQRLCRIGSAKSCALFMDVSLHQALFFTKDACPLKLLCTQIMGLSCLPVNREMRWHVTRSVVQWLDRMMDGAFGKEVKWMPTAALSENEDRCFDVMECFVYLLNLCLKDYFILFPSTGGNELSEERKLLASIIADGCLLFKRILKLDHRLLHEVYSLRFGTLVKNFKVDNSLEPHQREAVLWIVNFFKSDLKSVDGCVNFGATTNFPNKVVFDTLRLDNDLIIF